MNYEGEKFLLKLYRELYKEESVKHSGNKSDDKFELVNKYLKRLESTEKAFTREKEGAVNYLKNRYYDKYVIKEDDIPESYYELQKRIALENGYGHIEYTDELKHKEANILIKEQQKSLDKWLNYLMKENTSYPMWARYWAFQGMLKLGKYDKQKGSFTRRSKGTTSPFIELNAEALALSIGTVVNYQRGENIDDEKLENLVKSGNFGKIYAYNIWKIIEDEKKNLDSKVDTTEGIWKEYKEDSHKEIVRDIEGKGTGWCIAGEEVAREYSEMGRMHIYYTKDKDGNYTIPRVCIREEFGKLAEVRGVEPNQNMEPEMLEVTDRKLDEFPDKEEYKIKVSDMKMLTAIYKKFKTGKQLTNDEMKFVLEIEREIEGFGWDIDPRIDEVADEIFVDSKSISLFEGVKFIRNGKIFRKLTSAKGLESLEEISGNANFENLTSAEGLKNLKTIFGTATFSKLKDSKGLESLEVINGKANFENLTSAEGLKNLKTIFGTATFSKLKDSKGLESLKRISGNANFENLTSAEGLKNLKTISGTATFSKLKDSKGLESLDAIYGDANFKNLVSAKGLKNLQEIRGNANFEKLENAEGLENLIINSGYENISFGIKIDVSELVQRKRNEEKKQKLDRAKKILIANYKKQGLTDKQIEEQLNKLPKHLR